MNRLYSRRGKVLNALIRLALTALLLLILNLFIVCVIPQHGNQMYPAVRDGDLILALRLSGSCQTGTVWVYSDPSGKWRIGRIAAAAGATVDVSQEGRLLINGLTAGEEAFYPTAQGSGITFPYTVPEGCVFILNDHRTETDDSRTFAAIPKSSLRGQIFWQISGVSLS